MTDRQQDMSEKREAHFQTLAEMGMSGHLYIDERGKYPDLNQSSQSLLLYGEINGYEISIEKLNGASYGKFKGSVIDKTGREIQLSDEQSKSLYERYSGVALKEEEEESEILTSRIEMNRHAREAQAQDDSTRVKTILGELLPKTKE